MSILNRKKIASILGLYLSLIFLLPFQAVGQDWSLQDPSKGWNSRELVSLYFHNSELQTQWAWEALSHYSFKGNEHILDFGTGDGKLAALMSFMVPKGDVHAVDISEEMIAFASKMYPKPYYKNLTFLTTRHIDFSENYFLAKFDIVTSFCVFHLVPNPITVLKNIKTHMHSDSKLIVTYPISGNPEFFQAAREEMAKRNWNFPAPTEETKTIRDPSKARQIFKEAGFKIKHFQVVDTRNSYSSKKELIDWLEGTLSANWNIPAEGRREFFSDLADRYLKYRPQDKDEDGFVYYSLKRIDVVATPISR